MTRFANFVHPLIPWYYGWRVSDSKESKFEQPRQLIFSKVSNCLSVTRIYMSSCYIGATLSADVHWSLVLIIGLGTRAPSKALLNSLEPCFKAAELTDRRVQLSLPSSEKLSRIGGLALGVLLLVQTRSTASLVGMGWDATAMPPDRDCQTYHIMTAHQGTKYLIQNTIRATFYKLYLTNFTITCNKILHNSM